MINVSRLLRSPRFVQSFTVYRKGGSFVEGEWVQTETAVPMFGVITAASAKDLLQVPEGDRVKGIMAFYSTRELIVTNETGTSDEVVWNNERYRLFQLWPYKDYGFYKALGERMAGV